MISLRGRTLKENVLCVQRMLSQFYSFQINPGGDGLTSASGFISHPVVCWVCRDREQWQERVTSSLVMIYPQIKKFAKGRVFSFFLHFLTSFFYIFTVVYGSREWS